MASQRQRKSPEIGIKAPFPGFIEPALASSVERVPSGERWIHEIKFDGYRVQVHLANEAVTIYTRRGYDWTKRGISGRAPRSLTGKSLFPLPTARPTSRCFRTN